MRKQLIRSSLQGSFNSSFQFFSIAAPTVTTLTAVFIVCSFVSARTFASADRSHNGSSPSIETTSTRSAKQVKIPVFADLSLLDATGITALSIESSTQVAYAEITRTEQEQLSQKAHEWNRCGGFEDLTSTLGSTSSGQQTRTQSPNENSTSIPNASLKFVKDAFRDLALRQSKDQQFSFTHALTAVPAIAMKAEIKNAVEQVSEQNVKDTIAFYSTFHTRFNKGSSANEAPEALKARIEAVLKNSKIPFTVEFISHQSTPQKSIHVRLPGKLRPSEIVVLGGHLDSINQAWFGNDAAPGADDNASGTADLLEALRIVTSLDQTDRTLDFFWYAGEESGLLGSAEIAKTYKTAKADVIGVMQLDMTLHPGSGEFVLGSMTDFTSAWMRAYLTDINTLYIHAKVAEDKCGYGCSDHASWYRQGYPTIMPFESKFNGMNPNIHTANDVVNAKSDFAHSAMFAKIAVAIAEDLGNSTEREQ